MKVEFSGNLNFGRVIGIKYTGEDKDEKRKTKEVEKVLNSKTSEIYTDEQSDKIREFFRNVLYDYNGKDGVRTVKSKSGEIFLLSGKDFKNYNKLNQKKEQRIENMFNDFSINEKERSKQIKQIKKNAIEKIEHLVIQNQENGKSKKPETTLLFDGKKDGYYTTFQYQSVNEITRRKPCYGMYEDACSNEPYHDIICDYDRLSL